MIIRNAQIVNEGKIFTADVYVKDGRIDRIGDALTIAGTHEEIDAKGMFLLPGAIDDQVHFREPGLTHKGDIFTESRAAVAGGITSYMEMPNTVPQTVTHDLLEEKYAIGAKNSLANFSFFMGATNHNLEEILKTDHRNVCGIKVFMGSSTGDMLVDDEKTLDGIFSKASTLVATHCEDEATIRINAAAAREKYGEQVPVTEHPIIRNVEACYRSSSLAVSLAKKYGTRLHVLHISTAKETSLFDNTIPLSDKRITAEACVHHLFFTDEDYGKKGNFIKWNPAVKTLLDREEIRKAVLDNRIDIIATDHAPHTLEEKSQSYFKCPSGGPLVQHALVAMLEGVREGWITIEKVVEKMAHAPAVCFQVKDRGFIREGYWADLVLVDLNNPWTVSKKNILYKCGWSPFEGTEFTAKVMMTMVSGHVAFNSGVFNESQAGMRLQFNRD
jgi:dihydroorotase